MSEKEFVGEHRHLIGLLSKVGEEGKKQERELSKVLSGGKSVLKGHPYAKKGSTIEEVILGHFKMGHELEELKTDEDGRRVTFNLFWKPSKQQLDKLNKEFMTFRFHQNGTLSALRGRQFARDAEVLIRRLKEYQQGQVMGSGIVGDICKTIDECLGLTNPTRQPAGAMGDLGRMVYPTQALVRHVRNLTGVNPKVSPDNSPRPQGNPKDEEEGER